MEEMEGEKEKGMKTERQEPKKRDNGEYKMCVCPRQGQNHGETSVRRQKMQNNN